MNTEINSNMPIGNTVPNPKSKNIVLILIVAIVLFAAGFLVGKYILVTNELEENKDNTNITENINTTDNTNQTETDIYAEYLENLDKSMNTEYTEYTHPHVSIYNDMYSFQYYLGITKDKELMLNDEKIADDVLTMFIVEKGNGGFKSLYYVDKDGKLFVAPIEEYIYNKETKLDITSLNYKNIVNVTSGINSTDGMASSYSPVFIDIDGNAFMEE